MENPKAVSARLSSEEMMALRDLLAVALQLRREKICGMVEMDSSDSSWKLNISISPLEKGCRAFLYLYES